MTFTPDSARRWLKNNEQSLRNKMLFPVRIEDLSEFQLVLTARRLSDELARLESLYSPEPPEAA